MLADSTWIIYEVDSNGETSVIWIVLLGMVIDYNPPIRDICLGIISNLFM